MGSRIRRRACCAFASLGALAVDARAEDALRVAYEAPPECPDPRAAEAILSARVSSVVVSPDDVSASARIRIASAEGEFEGTLETADADGEPTTRTLVGASCRDVVDALAVVAAMGSGATRPSTPSTPSTPTPIPEKGSQLVEASRDADAPRRVPASRSSMSAEMAVGLHGGVLTGATPSAAPRGEVVVSLGAWRRASTELVRFWPRARLSLGIAGSSASVERIATRFSLLAGGLDACPMRIGGDRFEVSPCARAELGTLSAEPRSFEGTRTRETRWLAIGGVAVLTARIRPPVFIDATFGVVAPLQRDRFYFEPSTTVQQVGAVAVVGGAGVGLSIW